MRSISVAWLCVATLQTAVVGPSHADPIKVFLFGGQSNMRGNVANAPAELRNQSSILYSYNSSSVSGLSTFQQNAWTVLDQLPANGTGQFIGSTYGPELAAGRLLAQHFGATNESPIAFVKISRDASRMRVADDSWNVALRASPSSDAMLRIFYEQVAAALSNPINGTVPDYEICGMFWMQGESDANPVEDHTPTDFKVATETMISDIRTTLGVPTMPFFMGELGDFDGSGDSLAYRAVQMEIASGDPFTHFVSTIGLTRYSDDVHFDSAGIQGLGKRFAEAYIASHAVPEASSIAMVCALCGVLLAAERMKRCCRCWAATTIR